MRHSKYRRVFSLALLMAVLGSAMSTREVQAQEQNCFPETGHCISGRFRDFWLQNGGLAVFGFPITPAREERNRDTGQTYLTQSFERNRFELHPENQRPYDVLLGRLGDDRLLQAGRSWQQEGREPGPRDGCLWFEQTGHNVCNQGGSLGFRRYWESHGLQDPALDTYQRSLALFGLPLTAPRTETNASGDTVLTQWFERARFEWHPGKPDEFKVLLGLLGAQPEAAPNKSSLPEHLAAYRGELYFSADDGNIGRELWKSDGTPGGTTLVKDIFPGAEFGLPLGLTVVGDTLFFAATAPGTGTELWRSDGTAAGTFAVKDINPGANGSHPSFFTVVNGLLYFVADDGVHGAEIWKSDGTPNGTELVKDINPGPASSAPDQSTRNGGPGWELTAVGSRLFFVANDGTNGSQLWTSDGSRAGTTMLKPSGADYALPYELEAVGNTLFFGAIRINASTQLWKSDGTRAGTVPVKDWGTAMDPFGPQRLYGLIGVNNTLYLTVRLQNIGVKLWKSDGTESGTVIVEALDPRGAATPVAVLDGALIVMTNDEPSAAMWRTDGTAAGTVKLANVSPRLDPSVRESRLTQINGRLVFENVTVSGPPELWVSDGTPAGTRRVVQVPGINSTLYSMPIAAGRNVFFIYDDGRTGLELWRSNLTPEGTGLVRDINTK